MRLYWAFLAILAPAALAAGSCALEGFTIEGGGGSMASSGSSPGDDAGDAKPGACGAIYPPPPEHATPGGGIEFTAAVQKLDLGDQGVPIGLNLDLLCSCHGDGPSCRSKNSVCDDDQGRDNETVALFKTLSLALNTVSSVSFSNQAYQGRYSLLLRVRGYNGEPDDGQVEVDWYISPGFLSNPAGDGGTGPLWDGNDSWKVSAGSLVGKDLETPLYRDLNAYVSGKMLVAALPALDLVLTGGGSSTFTLHIVGAGVLAQIDQNLAMRWRLINGQIVGRWKTADVFKAIGSYRDFKGNALCTNNALYPTGKDLICNNADILSGVGTPSQTCDAISLAIGFTAEPAQLPAMDGGIIDPADASADAPCAIGTDPSNDSCPP